MQITLDGIPPSKKNSRRITTRGRRVLSLPSLNYNRWEYDAVIKVKQATNGWKAGGMAKLSVCIGRKHKTRRDLDNALTSVCDMLVKAGVVADDSLDHIWFMGIYWVWSDNEFTRIEINDGNV